MWVGLLILMLILPLIFQFKNFAFFAQLYTILYLPFSLQPGGQTYFYQYYVVQKLLKNGKLQDIKHIRKTLLSLSDAHAPISNIKQKGRHYVF